MRHALLLAFVVLCPTARANPHPDPKAVPQDAPSFFAKDVGTNPGRVLDAAEVSRRSVPMLRVRIDYDVARESWSFGRAVHEASGTPGLVGRAARRDPYGSYRAELVDATGTVIAHDALGTGSQMRRLSRALSFRFPVPPAMPVALRVYAEEPQSGEVELVLVHTLAAEDVEPRDEARHFAAPEIRELRAATAGPKVVMTIYAEAYRDARRATFFEDAARLVRALEGSDLPLKERIEVLAVFSPSATALGAARDLGQPIPERDSFLGLYFPYWNDFGRWYNVVYPTREERFRAGLASAPYDYPVALVDDSAYWGVGNYRELTAIPARNGSFTYLLLHELGHSFGLNEEYEGGGPTELQFAPDVEEPWSQNITFLRDPTALKWREDVAATTPIPTPASYWRTAGRFGAYRGGYADSEPQGRSHKPGFACTMASGETFCPICRRALEAQVRFDAGEPGP